MEDGETQLTVDSAEADPDDETVIGVVGGESVDDELQAAAPPGATPERWVGRYIPIKKVGRGAFGAVYAAYDPQLDRKIALKLLRAGRRTANNRVRLLREARALAAISHPNVVAVFDVGEQEDGGAIHIAMEFVEGVSLRKWVERVHPSTRRLLAVLVAIAHGLEAAHASGLAHRDIKPDNIMVTPTGVPKIVDFGLARAGHSPSEDGLDSGTASMLTNLTSTGAIVGTPAYMAPEQHDGARGDAKADQYSFCVLAYEAFVGARPFTGANIDALRIRVHTKPPTPPPRGSMPRWLWPVLQRGLAVDPAKRHASMTDLLRENRTGPRPSAASCHRRGSDRRGRCRRGGDRARPPGSVRTGRSGDRRRVGRRGARTDHRGVRSGPPRAGCGHRRARHRRDGRVRLAVEGRRGRQLRGEPGARGPIGRDVRPAGGVLSRGYLTVLAETVQLWREGAPTVVDHARAAVTELPSPEDCAEVRAFRGLQPRPIDPAARAELASLEDELSRAQAQWSSGRPPELDELRRRAASVGYRPLQARVEMLSVSVHRFVGDQPDASYATAQDDAIAGGDTRVAIAAAMQECRVHRLAHEIARAQDACGLAGALIDSEAGGDAEDERQRLAVLRAEIQLAQGDVEAARESLTRTLAVAKDEGDRALLFDATWALGRVEYARGKVARAVDLMTQAKALGDEIYGPLHPTTMSLRGDLVGVAGDLGNHEETERQLEALIADEVRARGESSPNLWKSLMHLAWTQYQLGERDEALATIENARRHFAEAPEKGAALCYLAGAHMLIAYNTGHLDRARAAVEDFEAAATSTPTGSPPTSTRSPSVRSRGSTRTKRTSSTRPSTSPAPRRRCARPTTSIPPSSSSSCPGRRPCSTSSAASMPPAPRRWRPTRSPRRIARARIGSAARGSSTCRPCCAIRPHRAGDRAAGPRSPRRGVTESGSSRR